MSKKHGSGRDRRRAAGGRGGRSSDFGSATAGEAPARGTKSRGRDGLRAPGGALSGGLFSGGRFSDTSWPSAPLTDNPALLTALYRESWLAKRIIDMPCEDMTRSWYTLSPGLSPEDLESLRRTEARHEIRREITNAVRWARLYGGACALMVLRGQEDRLEEPLDPDFIAPGDFRGLLVRDRVDGVEPSLEIETALEGTNTRIVVTGVPAHASMPEKGRNAAKMLLRVLRDLDIGGEPVALLVEASCDEERGEGLGIAGCDAVSGPLTVNLGLLSLKEGQLSVTYDCRYPVMFNGQTVRATVAKRLSAAGFRMLPGRDSVPHHVPETSELVQKLMGVYNGILGVEEKPFAIGGGTSARHLEAGVAFGMLFPGEPELEHQPDESIDLGSFVKAARIYAYAILALCR